MYGARGVNGVIMVTTKKGTEENMNTYEYRKNGYLYSDDLSLALIAKNLERW